MSDAAVRAIPPGSEHSIAWMIWHSARIEDVTLFVLVANGPQLLCQDGWFEKLKVKAKDTGNLIDDAAG